MTAVRKGGKTELRQRERPTGAGRPPRHRAAVNVDGQGPLQRGGGPGQGTRGQRGLGDRGRLGVRFLTSCAKRLR